MATPDLPPGSSTLDTPSPRFTLAGRYAVVRLLGEDSMGPVYQGWDSCLDLTITIKTIPIPFLADLTAPARFIWKAQAFARLNHPNILTLGDYGTDTNLHYRVAGSKRPISVHSHKIW